MSNGTGISFVNNDRENIRLISNIIANNTVIGITWTATADGGDYYVANNSFDNNATAITTNAAAQLALHVTLRDNHYEFNATTELNHFSFAGGSILIAGGLLVDQSTTGPVAQLISVSGATTALTVRDLIAHKKGSTATYLVTATSSATTFFENVVLFGNITNLVQLSGAGPSIQLQAASPQIISNIADVFGAIQFFGSAAPSGTCASNTLAIWGGGNTYNGTLYLCNPTVNSNGWQQINVP